MAILYVQKKNGHKILKTKSTLLVFCLTACYTKMFSTKYYFKTTILKLKTAIGTYLNILPMKQFSFLST